MTNDELLRWAAKLIDYMHDNVELNIKDECHKWFDDYWAYRKREKRNDQSRKKLKRYLQQKPRGIGEEKMKIHKAIGDYNRLRVVCLCTHNCSIGNRMSTNWNKVTCKNCLKKKPRKK